MGERGTVVTYGELERRSLKAARLLHAAGLRRGDVLAILMENHPAFFEVAWAAQRSGLYYTAINSHLTAAEVQYVLDDSGAKALVTTEALSGVARSLELSAMALRLVVGGELPGFDRYEDRLALAEPAPLPDEAEGSEMLYSSGTTGRPKGVRKPLSLAPLGDPSAIPVLVAQGLAERFGIDEHAVYLSPAPLYHAAPLVTCMAVQRLGGTVVVMERFDPALFLELVERHRVTHTQLVPTMFVRLLRLDDATKRRFDLSSLRMAVHAAAPCPVEVKRRMLEWWGPIIHEYYSGTEHVGSTWITPEEWLAHPGSVGRPVEEVHIVGPDGEELGPGEEGVVYFGGGVPFEYHNDPEKTASITHPRGWRTLGDVGYLDEDGYLYLTDRAAHVIVSGGVNVYPQEAENVLAAHPAVRDVAVIGVPDADLGEQVKAVVELEDPSLAGPALEAELVAWCRERLAGYKCPRSVDFVEGLPRDPNGKLYKRRLKDRYWEGHGTRIV
jgi:long-chain acyl-CoA synthetase